MKKNKEGFLLLSFLVYLFLFTLLIVLSFDWAMTFFTTYTSHAKKNRALINSYAAQDLLVRDVHRAPFSEKKWKKITATEVIWSIANHDIGWDFKEKKLRRIEGEYNKQKQKWDKKTTSIAAQDIDKLIFTITKKLFTGNSFIKNVTVEYTITGRETIVAIMSLKNRVVA